MKLFMKAVSLMLAFSMAAASFAGLQLNRITASAAAPSSSVHIWDGTADTSWYTGDEDSYDIYTPEELAGLAKLTRVLPANTFDGIAINLMSDIVLNDTTNWQSWETTPPKNSWKCIGANSHPFTGGFNGNGHTISGLYMLSDGGWLALKFNEVGLFDTISGAMICDLRMEKCVIIGMGNGIAGVLAAKSENCYVENVEVKDIIVGCGQVAGGLIGEINRYDIVDVILTNMAFAALGFVLNPIFFIDQIKQYNGTVVSNCKVTNALFLPDRVDGAYWEHTNGGLTGSMYGGAVLNSVSENCTMRINRVFNDYRLGAITGGKPDSDYKNVVKNCYSYNFQLTGKNPKQADADRVTALSKDEYLSSDLVAQLGDGFTSAPNGTPVIAALKEATLNEEIIAGDFDNSGKIEMSDIASALTAYLKNSALDYRTFKAVDADNNGRITMSDIAMLLNIYLRS